METLKKAKLKWLQNTILLTEIKDFIIDSELKAATVAGNGSQVNEEPDMNNNRISYVKMY